LIDGDNIDPKDVVMLDGIPHLKSKPNGHCSKLRVGGCKIHKNKPAACRVMDCRVYYFSTFDESLNDVRLKTEVEREDRVREQPLSAATFAAGKARLATLPPEYVAQVEANTTKLRNNHDRFVAPPGAIEA
jgi:Fe-S-cluster containining protein